jgi:hypothetical protein
MLLPALSLTYLGIVLLYAASPASPPRAARPIQQWGPAGSLRGGGVLVLGGGLGLAVLASSMGEGLLIWLAMAMASCSFVVIAGPLVGPLVPATGLFALGLALVGGWT